MRTPFSLKVVAFAVALLVLPHVARPIAWAKSGNQILEWNQVLVDTLIATNTPNSSSQRLGAIVHTAIFDAFNGIDRRYAPLFVEGDASTTRFAQGGRRRCGLHRADRALPVAAGGARCTL